MFRQYLSGYIGDPTYNPTIPSKFISRDRKKIWLFTAGNFIRPELSLDGLWMVPMTLEVA
jgi:hypothetical protein